MCHVVWYQLSSCLHLRSVLSVHQIRLPRVRSCAASRLQPQILCRFVVKCRILEPSSLISLVHPEVIAFGADLNFTADVLFIFFYICQREISEMHQPIIVKFCTVINSRSNFIMPVQTFGGTPQKKFRAKNMQNLAQFRTTSKFDGKYLWNG